MKTNLNKELFSETGCIERRLLLNYRDGLLKRSDMHLVEKHLVDCSLCSEALEGLSTIQDDSVLNEISQHFNPQAGKSTTPPSPFRYLTMAASLAAVIALSYFAVQQSKNAAVQEQALFTPPTSTETVDSSSQSTSTLESSPTSTTNNSVAAEPLIKNESLLVNPKQVAVQKDNEEHSKELPSPSEELKDMVAAGVTDNEGVVLNSNDNFAMDIEPDTYVGTVESSQKSVKTIDEVSLSKQASVRGSRTPGATAPSAASNSNIANAEVAVVYDKSKFKKEETQVDPYSLYKKGDYTNALIGFEARLKTNTSDFDAMFHKGMCLYHLKRHDEALTSFSSIPKKGNKFSDEAMFYIGQTYEQKGDKTSAISAYRILVESKSAFSSKASKRINLLEGR